MKGQTELFGLIRGRRIAGAFLTLQLGACSSWRLEQVSPAQLVRERAPHQVRIKQAGQTPLVLEKPSIVGDSLTGVAEGQTRGVPLTGITAIATRHSDPVKSVFLGVVIAGSALGIAVAVAAANCDCGVGLGADMRGK